MQRFSLIAAFIGVFLSSACLAAEPSLCTSTCNAERRVCNTKAIELARFEREAAQPIERYRHSLASNASKLQTPSPAEQAIGRSSMEQTRIRDAGACDDSHARCTRSCTNTVAASVDSPVIVRKRQAN